MHLEGNTTINAPREQVWSFLTDPYQVTQAAPGLESVEVVEPGKRFHAVAAIGFGSIKVRFGGNVDWLEMDPPNRAKMKAHGKAPGSAADVVSEMSLAANAAGGTDMHWTADVTVVGQIASLASRLMGSVSQKMTGAFFDEVRRRIEAGGGLPPAAAAAATAAGAPTPGAQDDSTKPAG